MAYSFRATLCLSACLLSSFSYAKTQLLLYPEEAKSLLSVRADNLDDSSPESFSDEVIFALTQGSKDSPGVSEPRSIEHDSVEIHQTNQECCRSYEFLGIPVTRGWWVSIKHDGQVQYLCDRNDTMGREPKLYVEVQQSEAGARLTFETAHYCEEANRIESSEYAPSEWKSVTVDIH